MLDSNPKILRAIQLLQMEWNEMKWNKIKLYYNGNQRTVKFHKDFTKFRCLCPTFVTYRWLCVHVLTPWAGKGGRSQKFSQNVKNSYATRLCFAAVVRTLNVLFFTVLYTLWRVICDLLQYTRTEKCNLFVKYENFLIIWSFTV